MSQLDAESKTIALVAHDKKKPELIAWADRWQHKLRQLTIYATGTTGGLLKDMLGLDVTCLKSGPLGGDQQIGALIAEARLDYLVFFWDPLLTQGHDSDVKALMRLAVVWNVPMACNLSTADFLIGSSDLITYIPQNTEQALAVN